MCNSAVFNGVTRLGAQGLILKPRFASGSPIWSERGADYFPGREACFSSSQHQSQSADENGSTTDFQETFEDN